MTIPSSIFLVNDDPYCIWDIDLAQRNLGFLNSVNPLHFEYLATTALREFQVDDNKQSAATLLRTSYYHGLETLFSYIGALLQGPDCAYAWINKCKSDDLKNIISRIDRSDSSLPRKISINSFDWHGISEIVHQYSDPDASQAKLNIDNFSACWSKLADEFLRQSSTDEYNSLKHGFRVLSGGFSLFIGRELTPGKKAPPDKMKILTHSDFGSTYYTLQRTPTDIKSNRSYRSKQTSINWDFGATYGKLMLIATSLNNVLSAMKIINGVDDSSAKFMRPVSPEMFTKPWAALNAHSTFSMDFTYSEGSTQATTKHELLDMLSRYMATLDAPRQENYPHGMGPS